MRQPLSCSTVEIKEEQASGEKYFYYFRMQMEHPVQGKYMKKRITCPESH